MLVLTIYCGGNLRTFEIFFEFVDVEVQLFGVVFEDRVNVRNVAPVALLFEKQVVHFPKFSLARSGFGGKCCFAPVLVIGQGKMPEHDP